MKNNEELAAPYILLQIIKLALIGAGIGGNIKHTSGLKELNTRKPCKALTLMMA